MENTMDPFIITLGQEGPDPSLRPLGISAMQIYNRLKKTVNHIFNDV